MVLLLYRGFCFLRKKTKIGWVEGGEDLEDLRGKNNGKIYLKLKIILNNKNIIKEELSNKEFLYQRGAGQEK